MDVDCIGAGPGGLFFSILVKLANPSSRVRVFERSSQAHVSGFGIILDSEAQALLKSSDSKVGHRICQRLFQGDTVEIDFTGDHSISDGHSICAISRGVLLQLLRERAEELGVDILYGQTINEVDELSSDIIVACDGAASSIRTQFQHVFRPDIHQGTNRFVWCQVRGGIPGIKFSFRKSYGGWVWSQAYQHDESHSTVILECDNAAYRGLAETTCSEAEQVHAVVDTLFGQERYTTDHLKWVGARSSESLWRCFPNINCAKWYHGNIVLLGDAAHTAHYSIGSGTKLALGDAVALQRHLFAGSGTLEARLEAYTSERLAALHVVQRLSCNSQQWFEDQANWDSMSTEEFAYALLSRTQQPCFSVKQLRRMQVLVQKLQGSTKNPLTRSLALRRAGLDSEDTRQSKNNLPV